MKLTFVLAGLTLALSACNLAQNLGGGGGTGTTSTTSTTSSSNPTSCKDGVENGAETDVDCGGAVCPACATGQKCLVDSDCKSGDCVANVCQSGTAVSCTDGIQDGIETDVDCGGGTCSPCAVGKKCLLDADCTSNACDTATNVCVASQCNDQLQDGAETDVDCGGPTCAPCATGKHCAANSDCNSNDCVSGVCQSGGGSSCSNGVQDGAETDVDCGGSTCSACALGRKCVVDTDCVTNACDAVTLLCVASQCSDHRLDGNETDVDCGGPTCTRCATGQHCTVNSDCAGGSCVAGACN